MSSIQVLYRQLAALERLESQLGCLINTLEDHKNQYSNKVDGLHQSGLSDEAYHKYRQYFANDSVKINGLIHDIESMDIPYIRRNIQQLKETINAANQGGY